MKDNSKSPDNEKNRLPKKLGKLPLSKPGDPTLKWSGAKHDLKRESFRLDEAQGLAKSRVGTHYAEWKGNLKRQIKRSKGKLTAQDLIASLYDLQTRIANTVKHVEGMKEWYDFTMQIIEDHVGTLILTSGWTLNLFSEFPADAGENSFSVPQRYTFSTVGELMDTKPIKPLRERQGFIGLVRENKVIYAMYGAGELVPLGAVLSLDDEIKRLPTRHEIDRELSKEPPR